MDILVTVPEGELRETFLPEGLRERLASLGTVTSNDADENRTEAELRDRIEGVDLLVIGVGKSAGHSRRRRVGLGTVGRKLLGCLAPFDVSVSVYDPYLDPEDLVDVPDADLTDLDTALDSAVVSVRAARTEETIGMLDADRLVQIPDDALFVTTARAELVDEDTLMTELEDGQFRCALDVYHEEPLPPEADLRQLDDVLLTSHVGGSQVRPPRPRRCSTISSGSSAARNWRARSPENSGRQ